MSTASGSEICWFARCDTTTTGITAKLRRRQSGSRRVGRFVFGMPAALAGRQQAGEAAGIEQRQHETQAFRRLAEAAMRAAAGAARTELGGADEVGDLPPFGGERAGRRRLGVSRSTIIRARRPACAPCGGFFSAGEAVLSFVVHAVKLHRSRGADAPELCCPRPPGAGSSPRKKARGTARQAAHSPYRHANLGPRGASRRAVSAFFAAPGRAFGQNASARRPFWAAPCRRAHAVSELLAGGRSAPGRSPGAARARALLRARPRAPARSPRDGATGSRPPWGSGEVDYKRIYILDKCEYIPRM